MLPKFRLALLLLLMLGLSIARAELPAETPRVEKLAFPPGKHWVYVVDLVFPHLTEGKIVLLDVDTKEPKGMMTTGFLAGMATSPDQKEVYVTETFYSRGTRGERTDVLSIFSADELKPIGEVVLPPKRFIAVTMPYGTVVTTDGRFLLQFNFNPATSVSVVDLKARKLVGEIATPGCSLIYPGAGSRVFSMLCTDGRLLTVDLDDEGKARATHMSEKRFFDPDHESINVAPAQIGNRFYFVSFTGDVVPLEHGAATPAAGERWSLVSGTEARAGWRPGGWVYATANEKLNRLYVVMHKGKAGSHKDPGGEVWVFDLASHQRLQRIKTKTPVVSLQTSRDDAPLLYAMGAEGHLHVYDATSGKYRGSAKNIAESAVVMVNP